MLKLDPTDIQKLVEILTPVMGDEYSRFALLTSAFGIDSTVDDLRLGRTPNLDLSSVLLKLANSNLLSNGDEALLVLLRYISSSRYRGIDSEQKKIVSALIQQIEDRIEGATVQPIQQSSRTSPASELTRLVADVLLICVTKVEVQAVLTCVKEKFDREASEHFEQSTFYNLGEIGGARTFMMRSEMSAGGPSGALLTISQGIDQLKPTSVIMVGIAFGVDPDKQEIGEILVSKQLLDYDLQRVGTDAAGGLTIVPRGDRPSASPRLLPRFRAGEIRWQDSKVDFGLILSGDKLVDNIDYREQLRQLEPEAIGGEMEGAGLYAAAYNRQVDWILVKAICDWADGKKRENKAERQRTAAQNAANFTIEVIQRGGFGRSSEAHS